MDGRHGLNLVICNPAINAALIVFSQEGLNGARMEQIAEEADISKSNIFYYFQSKEVLYVAVLEKVLSKWLSPLSEINANQDPRVALRPILKKNIKSQKNHLQRQDSMR